MKCRSCGAENLEGMKFCTSCGSKLEQKRVCPSCGSEAEEGAAFCGRCGAKIAQMPEPKKPVKKAEPVAEPVAEQATEKIAAPGSPATDEAFEDDEKAKPFVFSAKKVFGLASAILVIALAVALLAFVCFIGIGSVNDIGDDGNRGSVGILEYFGKAYTLLPEYIEKLDENLIHYNDENLSGFFKFTLYLPYVLSTVALAATIVLVAVFSIIALVAAIRKLLGNNKKDGGKQITLAYISYIIGALLIKSFSGGSAVSEYYSYKVGFNGATIAGITICSVLFGLFILCNFFRRGKEVLNVKTIANSAFAAAGIVLTGVIIGMIAVPAFSIHSGSDMSTCGYVQAIVSVGSMGMTVASLKTLTFPYLTSSMLCVAAAFGIAIAAVAGCAMWRCVVALLRKKSKSSFAMNIVLTSLALPLLVFAAVSGSMLAGVPDPVEMATPMSVTPVGSIVIFVLSLLLLGLMIGRVCVNNYLSKKPLAEEGAIKIAPKKEEEAF